MSSRRVMTFHNLQRIPEIGRCVQQFQNPAPIVARYLKPSYGQYPFEITTRRGHHAMLNDWMDLTTAWAIFCRQEYSVPRASRTIIDLGATVGYLPSMPPNVLLVLESCPWNRSAIPSPGSSGPLRRTGFRIAFAAFKQRGPLKAEGAPLTMIRLLQVIHVHSCLRKRQKTPWRFPPSVCTTLWAERSMPLAQSPLTC